MKVPPLINTMPFTEVSPLNCKEESIEALVNLAGTIIQEVAESFLDFKTVELSGPLLHENNKKVINVIPPCLKNLNRFFIEKSKKVENK